MCSNTITLHLNGQCCHRGPKVKLIFNLFSSLIRYSMNWKIYKSCEMSRCSHYVIRLPIKIHIEWLVKGRNEWKKLCVVMLSVTSTSEVPITRRMWFYHDDWLKNLVAMKRIKLKSQMSSKNIPILDQCENEKKFPKNFKLKAGLS